MKMPTIKSSYLLELREKALKAHSQRLTLAFNKAKEAVKLKQSDALLEASRSPSDFRMMHHHHERLNKLAEEVLELESAAEEAQRMLEPDVYMVQPDFNWWVHHYERDLYAPTADDFEPEEAEDSHETDEAVEVVE